MLEDQDRRSSSSPRKLSLWVVDILDEACPRSGMLDDATPDDELPG